ncbi:MAG: TrkA C-terminal domain-containing protein [Halioglobus sp.]
MEELTIGFEWLLELLRQRSVLLLFLLLGAGYVIGKINVMGFSLGPVAGVLFAGLFLGHHGLRIGSGAQSVGFALFIFSVGYQAGPRFFSALKADGLKYFILSMVVAVSAVLMTLAAAKLLALQPGMSAGLLAGGLTSSPTLAAAQDAVREGAVTIPPGYTSDQLVGNIASAYAITYIFGLTGLITIIKYLPRVLNIDLAAESEKLEQAGAATQQPVNITTRCYRVENPDFLVPTVLEIRERYTTRKPLATVKRNGESIQIEPTDHVQLGDVIELVGPRELFATGIADIGTELPLDWDLSLGQSSAVVVVTNRQVFDLTLGELDIPGAFGVLITKIVRSAVELPHSYDLALGNGDILTVVGPSAQIEKFGQYMGHLESDLSQTDMVTFAFGIVVGVLLGMLSFTVGGVAIGLGNAGGLLASGLAIGYLRSVRPTFGRLPEATSWWLMEFGLLLFMAGVGLRAGGSFLETLQHAGPLLIIAGLLITTIPLLLAYFVGSRWLKLNPAILMGALTGAMTSGASLSVVTEEAGSTVPAIGYAGTYAFGNVLLMVAGPLVILLA